MIAENKTTAQTIVSSSPVTVSLSDLQSSSSSSSSSTTPPIPDETLLQAFGPSSLGILIVSGLPAHFPALRSRVLSQISKLAHLPAHELETLVNEKAKYLVGWSHGKESLRDGVVDWLKGSYYVNTAFDETDPVVARMREEYPGFDEYLAPNVWPGPSSSTTTTTTQTGREEGLKDFRRDVEELISLIVDVARHVARAIDSFALKNVENWPATDTTSGMGYLEGVVSSSRTNKARLLHYFPADSNNAPHQAQQVQDENKGQNGNDTNSDDDVEDSWCSVHKDHSCLTGLTSAAFFDETATTTTITPSSTSPSLSSPGRYTELESSPSPSAGLYILDRESNIHKVGIPRDCLAFQTGEALERVTKGKLKAVPHFVRGVDASDASVQGRKIARNTLAVFTQPNLHELVDLDQGITFGEYARGIVDKNTT